MRFFLSGPRIMGIRPGVIFSGQDVARLMSSPSSAAAPERVSTDGFVYAITNMSGQVKIGVSIDPLARLAQLQTASHAPLTLAYAGISPSTGYEIEARAHEVLGKHRMQGEWFNIPVAVAVAALAGAAEELNIPLLRVDPSRIAEGLAIVKDQSATTKPKRGFLLTALLWTARILLTLLLVAIAGFVALYIQYMMTH